MRATLLCALAALAAAARAPGGVTAPATAAGAEGAVVTETRALPPFMSLELGRAGCFPLSVRVASGDSYALEVTAQARARSRGPHTHARTLR
jgi:hypothetical protein